MGKGSAPAPRSLRVVKIAVARAGNLAVLSIRAAGGSTHRPPRCRGTGKRRKQRDRHGQHQHCGAALEQEMSGTPTTARPWILSSDLTCGTKSSRLFDVVARKSRRLFLRAAPGS